MLSLSVLCVAESNAFNYNSFIIQKCTWIFFHSGTLPAKGDGVVSRRACVPSAIYYCEKFYNVSLQNCGAYSVYFLPRPTACSEAYCFGKVYLKMFWHRSILI